MTESKGQDGGKDATADAAAQAADAPALAVIEAFGGIRPMAKTLGLAVSTVQGWKERSAIPANRHDQIRAAASKHNIDIDPVLLRASAGDAAAAEPQVIEGQAVSQPAPQEPGAKPDAKTGAKVGAPAGTAPDTSPQASPRSSAATAAGQSARKAAGDAKPDTTAGDTPPPRRSAFLPGLAVGVVLAAVMAGAMVYTQPYWAPLFGGDRQGAATAEALTVLDARLTALQDSIPEDRSAALGGLNERLATLEAALSQGAGQDPETVAALESISAQLARITDRIQALEQDVASVRSLAGQPSAELTTRLSGEAARLDDLLAAQSELAARLVEAEERLNATLAARDAAPGSRETLLLLAVLQLRDALQGSGPYDEPLRMLRNLGAEEPALTALIEPLERRASVGLPSLRDLQLAFPEVARRIAAIEVGEGGEGWSAGVLRRLSEAVNLRPVGLVEGETPTAFAARAEVRLGDGDLAGALAELAGLSGAAAEAAAAWRTDAEARLAADRAVSELGALVSQRFNAMVGG